LFRHFTEQAGIILTDGEQAGAGFQLPGKCCQCQDRPIKTLGLESGTHQQQQVVIGVETELISYAGTYFSTITQRKTFGGNDGRQQVETHFGRRIPALKNCLFIQ
jgi:hypothetical protein